MPVNIEEELPTIFDVSGYPHYENVISNWYAFFLKEDNPHGLKDLFYSSLRKLINDDTYTPAAPWTVEREYGANENKRIDLLVHEGEENGSFKNPIIIENKIYAELYNDLDDYYDSIVAENKKLLILSLHGNERIQLKNKRSDEDKNNFLVRTHRQYIEKVRENISDYIASIEPKYFIYLQDFMNNIESMTRKIKMSNDMKYILEQSDNVNKLVKLRNDAHQNLFDNLWHAIQDRTKEGWCWGRRGSDYTWATFKTGKDGVEFTIHPNGLNVVISVYENDKSRVKNDEQIDIAINKISNTGDDVELKLGMLASRKYGVDKEQLDEFGNIVLDIVHEKWKPLIDAISNSDAQ